MWPFQGDRIVRQGDLMLLFLLLLLLLISQYISHASSQY
jgi:hypothetical protein